MKTPLLAVVCLLTLSAAGPARAADLPPDPQSDYARAVQTYVDAASDQLKAIRGELDAAAKPADTEEGKRHFAPVYAKLDHADKLLAILKTAGPADFDRIKLKFEQTRADMIKALEAARTSS